MKLKVPAAFNEDGRITRPENAVKGTDYRCPACRTIVTFRCGKIRRPHFGHRPNTGCSNESQKHSAAKAWIAQVINDYLSGKGKAIVIHRKCPNCGKRTQEPLPAVVCRAGTKERKTPDGCVVDVPLYDERDELVLCVEVLYTHEVSREKADRLTIGFIEVRADDILEDPYNWRPRQDTWPRGCCENCRLLAERAEEERCRAFDRDWVEALCEQDRREEERIAVLELAEEAERREEAGRERKRAVLEGLEPDQREALERVFNGGPLHFITGPAGYGKSYVINALAALTEGVRMTATTGCAAQLVGGTTLHSYIGWNGRGGKEYNPLKFAKKKRLEKLKERIKATKLLVVDEASMMTDQLLENLFRAFDVVGHAPKLILTGDFLQLPPVRGRPVYYHADWGEFKVSRLTKSRRQSSGDFLGALSDLRVGDYTLRLDRFKQSREVEQLPFGRLQLHSLKIDVNAANMEALRKFAPADRIVRRPWKILMRPDTGNEVANEVRFRNIARTRLRFPPKLFLSRGAPVCMLTNEPSKGWMNGSLGIVLGGRDDGVIEVMLDTGETVGVERQNEIAYDGDGNQEAIIRQYPMTLAYALTIHKAQGMTLSALGVNLDGAWEAGQIYTALSRCRTAEGIWIVGDLERIPVPRRALEICGRVEDREPLFLALRQGTI